MSRSLCHFEKFSASTWQGSVTPAFDAIGWHRSLDPHRCKLSYASGIYDDCQQPDPARAHHERFFPFLLASWWFLSSFLSHNLLQSTAVTYAGDASPCWSISRECLAPREIRKADCVRRGPRFVCYQRCQRSSPRRLTRVHYSRNLCDRGSTIYEARAK